MDVRPCHVDDVRILDWLQKKFSNEVGFLRQSDLADLVRLGGCRLLVDGGQVLGSLVWSGGNRVRPCLRQICVPEDLWDQGFGTLLLNRYLAEARARGWGIARVRTRRDVVRMVSLNAAAGGVVVGTSVGGARGVPVDEWVFSGDALRRGAVAELRRRLQCSVGGGGAEGGPPS